MAVIGNRVRFIYKRELHKTDSWQDQNKLSQLSGLIGVVFWVVSNPGRPNIYQVDFGGVDNVWVFGSEVFEDLSMGERAVESGQLSLFN